MSRVFITGGTGYLGRSLSAELAARGHEVRVLARASSQKNVAPGCAVVLGDALNADSYAAQVAPSDTLVHLVGVAHPRPSKAEQFRSIDLVGLKAAIAAAQRGRIRHFVYVSVAHPAPAMKAYVHVRMECEALLRASGLNATILRPWYVLGPGHRWPYALLPLYWLAERVPRWREAALRLGLVAHRQMVRALVAAVESSPNGLRIVEVPEIRAAGLPSGSAQTASTG